MRIVNRTEFLAMPTGTVFNKWKPMIFEEPCIKGETWGNDFLVQYLDQLQTPDGSEYMDTLYSLEAGTAIPMDFDSGSRDGLFDDEQLFAVWSDADVEALITRLQNRKQ